MRELRRKVLLPVFQLSELTTADDPQAIRRVVKQGKGQPPFTYYYRLKWDSLAERGFNYNLFPIVLDRNGAPWALGTIYILAQLEADPTPIMTTYQSTGEDLGAYKEWVDDQERPSEVMFHFPRIKLRRPTYRYSGFLQQKIQAGEIALATASRGIGTVVAIYRWLIDNDYFEPEYPPWEEKNYRVCFSTDEGRTLSKKVVSTDVSIHASKAEDPFDGTIRDGGKLRPLNGKEQDLILESTLSIGNTECYLIQLFILATGARIQTVCTLRVRYFLHPNPPYAKALSGDGEVFKLKAGPGTGIDTKKNKNGVLQIPRSVYELLHIYALSKRAEKRRSRFVSRHGEPLDHYLFLTQQGNPYYTAKSDVLRFKPNLDRRHEKAGQSVRQFLKDHVIPYVREHHNKHFYYRPHDLRASFGMNMTEQLMTQVQNGKLTLSRARMIVKELLWHESFATTDEIADRYAIGPSPSIQRKTAKKVVGRARAWIKAANADSRHHVRIMLGKLAHNAFLFLFICCTSVNEAVAREIETDGEIDAATHNQQYRSIKFRAGSKPITVVVPAAFMPSLRRFLELRRYLLGEKAFPYLFFTSGFHNAKPPGQIVSGAVYLHYKHLVRRIDPQLPKMGSRKLRASAADWYQRHHNASITAKVLQNSELTTQKRYNAGSATDHREELSLFLHSVSESAKRQRVIPIQALDDSPALEEGGRCQSFGHPVVLADHVPVKPNCKDGQGCLFCLHRVLVACEEDARKVASAAFVMEQVILGPKHEETLRPLIAKCDKDLEKIAAFENCRTMVERVRNEVFENGNLTPFFADKYQLFLELGITV